MRRRRWWSGLALFLVLTGASGHLAAKEDAASVSLTDVEPKLASLGLRIVHAERDLQTQREDLAAFKAELWGDNPEFEAVKPALETTAPGVLARAKGVATRYQALGDAKAAAEWERWRTDRQQLLDEWSATLLTWNGKYEQWTYGIDNWEDKLANGLKEFASLGPIKQQINAMWSRLEKARGKPDTSQTAADIAQGLKTLEPMVASDEELIVPCQADLETWRAEAKELGSKPKAWRAQLKTWEDAVAKAEQSLAKRAPPTPR